MARRYAMRRPTLTKNKNAKSCPSAHVDRGPDAAAVIGITRAERRGSRRSQSRGAVGESDSLRKLRRKFDSEEIDLARPVDPCQIGRDDKGRGGAPQEHDEQDNEHGIHTRLPLPVV